MVGGHKWKPQIISVDKSALPNELSYSVIGSLKWKLLGTTIYTQNKILRGTVATN